MLFMTICLSPILFIGWCFVKTIQFVVNYLKFDLRCASVKRKNPELYRQMKEAEFRMTNGRSYAYWVIKHNNK